MTARQLIRLGVLLVGLLALWGAVSLAGRRGTGSGDSTRLLGLDTAAVDSVLIRSGGDSVILARGAGGWRVNAYPAASEEIASLLGALADTAEAELVAESAGSHGRLGVAADSGRRVRIAGGRDVELVVGRPPGSFGKGYARQADGDAVYQLRGRLPELIARPGDEWRDRTIATVPADSIAAIEVQRGRARYVLRRDGARWRLGAGVPVDSARATELVQAVSRIRAAGFASPAEADRLRFDRPDRRLTVTGADGRTLAALVVDSTASGMWVRHDSGGTVWRMEGWEADRIAPAAETLR
jgi:hypothetical protein